MDFKEFLKYLEEGLFIADDKAEEGKSRVKKPAPKNQVITYGMAGGPGGYAGGGGIAPMAAPIPGKK